MKLSCAILLLKSATALTCWTCEEKNYSDCLSKGRTVTCPLGENESQYKTWSCNIVESQRHGNRVDHVIAGCKQWESCLNDWNNNRIESAISWPQCYSTDKRKISKCRQCCHDSNDCNKAWITAGAVSGATTAMTETAWKTETAAPSG